MSSKFASPIQAEQVTSQETEEEDLFLDLVMSTPLMQRAEQYLQDNSEDVVSI